MPTYTPALNATQKMASADSVVVPSGTDYCYVAPAEDASNKSGPGTVELVYDSAAYPMAVPGMLWAPDGATVQISGTHVDSIVFIAIGRLGAVPPIATNHWGNYTPTALGEYK